MTLALRAFLLAIALVATQLVGTAVHAQSYPTRPISFVVPYTAGSTTDSLARLLAAELAKRLGQPFIVRNLPGAVGTVGSQFVADSLPDGYTLMITPPAPLTPAANLPYDPIKAFVLIAPVTAPSDRSPVPISVYAPAGMPPAAVARLASAIKDSLAVASLQGQFTTMGLQAATGGQGSRAGVPQNTAQAARPAASTNTQQSQEDANAAQLKAANAGDSAAMLAIAFRYDTGNGYTKNAEQALTWYRKAADAGNASAMSMLGSRYVSGQGVEKSWEQAAIWYRKAAELGDAGAMHMVALTYDNGLGVTKDSSAAMSWYRRAADAGDVSAMCDLALKYRYGNGVPQNKSEAIAWYRKAAAKGFPPAKDELAKLEAEPQAATQQAGNSPAPSQPRASTGGSAASTSSAPTPAPAASPSNSGDSPFADALLAAGVSQAANIFEQTDTAGGSFLGGIFSSMADSIQQNGTSNSAPPAAASSDSTDSPVADALTGALLSGAANMVESDIASNGDPSGVGGFLSGLLSNLSNSVQQGSGASPSGYPTNVGGASAGGASPNARSPAGASGTRSAADATGGKYTEAQLRTIAQNCQTKVVGSAGRRSSGTPQVDEICSQAAFDICIFVDTQKTVKDYIPEADADCQILQRTYGASACAATCNSRPWPH